MKTIDTMLVLESINDANGKKISVSVDMNDVNASVVLVEVGGRKSTYGVAALVMSVISYRDNFEITDGFDGAQNTFIPITEIRKLVIEIFQYHPNLGRFETNVKFVPDCGSPF